MIAVYELLRSPSAQYPDGFWLCVVVTTDHDRVWYEQHLSMRLGLTSAVLQAAPFAGRSILMTTVLQGKARDSQPLY